MAVKLLNLTPHVITFVDNEGKEFISVKPCGTVARVSTEINSVGEIDGIPLTKTTFGVVEGVPEKEKGTICIVSSIVANAMKATGRDDIFIPNESVRDDQGRIIGCRSLGRI